MFEGGQGFSLPPGSAGAAGEGPGSGPCPTQEKAGVQQDRGQAGVFPEAPGCLSCMSSSRDLCSPFYSFNIFLCKPHEWTPS